MPDLRLMDAMLFDYGTTNSRDFRHGDIHPIITTVYKKKPGCMRIRPPPLKDIHTLSDRKNHVHVPLDLLVRPKEIVRTNPRHIQEKYDAVPDLGKDEVQKTRPRLIMTPAISLDDINDSQTRNLLIENVYRTTMKEAYSDVASSSSFKAPFPGLPAPPNPITLERLKVHYVSPEWRRQSTGWDRVQLRAHCDPSREFYLTRALKCDACKVTAAVVSHRKLMKERKKL